MQSKGLDFLRPIWAMIYSDKEIIKRENYFERRDYDSEFVDSELPGLNLSDNHVKVTYTRYVNNYKKNSKPNDKTIDDAMKDRLTPGCKFKALQHSEKYNLVGSARYKGSDHAMVLDKIHDGKFVFKNTYEENKQVQMPLGHEDAPEEFFFVHIKYAPPVKSRLEKTLRKLFSLGVMILYVIFFFSEEFTSMRLD